MFRKQVILAEKSHFPLVLHSLDTHAFEQMYDALSTVLNAKHHVQWHCVNTNSSLPTLTKFLETFKNSYIVQWIIYI